MEGGTNEFSFMLKPSPYGIGVFAVHDILAGAQLRLFGEKGVASYTSRKKITVPRLFQRYCIDRGEMLTTPADFGAMAIGWYVNHSRMPNATQRDIDFYATRNIFAGEEITIDYNTLGEVESGKESYYFS